MFPQRKLRFGPVAICLLTSLVFVLGLHVLSPSPENPIAKGTDELPTGESSRLPRILNFQRGPARSVSIEDKWAVRWRELNAQPEGPERDREMAAMLEELAALDPRRALSLAEAEPNPERRVDFFQAALRGWGGANPESAIAWAASQTLMDQGQAMAAVFHGAAKDPENALRLTTELSQNDPDRAQDYGSYLVAALNGVGEFDRAATFAADAPAEFRADLLNASYAGWADHDPEAAMKAIGQLSDPETKKMAFDAAISRWADNDAKAVAEYAQDLPEGPERTFAASVALRGWAASDVVGAATWMSRFDASPDLDFGAAMVATLPETLRQPQLATAWAENIVDPQFRIRVLATVVNEWATTDPDAARRFAETSPDIRPEDRLGVLAAFEPDFNPISLLP